MTFYDHLCIEIQIPTEIRVSDDSGYPNVVPVERACRTWSIELVKGKEDLKPLEQHRHGRGSINRFVSFFGSSFSGLDLASIQWGIWVYPRPCLSTETGKETRRSPLVPVPGNLSAGEFVDCLYNKGIERGRLAEARGASYLPRRNSNSFALELVRACFGQFPIEKSTQRRRAARRDEPGGGKRIDLNRAIGWPNDFTTGAPTLPPPVPMVPAGSILTFGPLEFWRGGGTVDPAILG